MSGSNMMDAEIELRTNERHIKDYIELFFFSIWQVWSEEKDYVVNNFLRNFSESEWNIGLLVSTCFISEMLLR